MWKDVFPKNAAKKCCNQCCFISCYELQLSLIQGDDDIDIGKNAYSTNKVVEMATQKIADNR